ncbi:MAG: hypothetical protein V3U84_06295, partial [Thiotrichaceae bacterium]
LEQFSLPDWEHYYQKVKHDLPEDFTTLNKEELAYWVDHLISLSTGSARLDKFYRYQQIVMIGLIAAYTVKSKTL